MSKARISLVMAAAICVIIAASTNVASAASFKSSTSPEALVGVGGTQTIPVGATFLKCAKITNETTKIAFPTEQLLLINNYSECEIEGVGKVASSCEVINFHANGTATLGKCLFEAPGICKLEVPSQLTSGLTYTNNAGSVIVKRESTGIKYTASAGCIGFSKEGKNMGYKGELKMTGKAGAKLELV